MVVLVARQSPLADMSQVPVEFDDTAYFREVLELENSQADKMNEQRLIREFEELGLESNITFPIPEEFQVNSTREPDKKSVSIHVRTVSSTSQDSSSTSLSSQLSNEHVVIVGEEDQDKIEDPSKLHQKNEYSGPDKLQSLHKAPLIRSPCQLRVSPYSLTHRPSIQKLKSCFKTKFFMPRLKQLPENSIELVCHHAYCKGCLREIIIQASENDLEMPPRCCGQLIPVTLIKKVLSDNEKIKFIESIMQLRNKWEQQILCPNLTCCMLLSDFQTVDLRNPYEVECSKCKLRVCSLCKSSNHASGRDCPSKWAIDAIKQLRDSTFLSYDSQCDTVEPNLSKPELIASVCQNKCGVSAEAWTPHTDIEPACNYETKAETQTSKYHLIKADSDGNDVGDNSNDDEKNGNFAFYQNLFSEISGEEAIAAEKRTMESVDFSILRARQVNERDRFRAFERKMKWFMLTRHGQERIQAQKKYEERIAKMRERHARAVANLEDCQVADEMDLRKSLEQVEQSVHTRLRHMEAYCDALGQDAPPNANLKRVVTERDLRELGQQYNVRDNMERLHQSKIKVLRDKQAKQIEKLLAQQDRELKHFISKKEDVAVVELRFKEEEESLANLFEKRKIALLRKWLFEEQIERKKLEMENNTTYAPLSPPIDWPNQELELES